MRRLYYLTAIALLALATTGCGRTWSSWFYRGESCDNCTTAPVYSGYSNYGGDYGPPVSTLPEPLP